MADKLMDWLMTYGWAIMVVLIAIGSLAYFGVLSPDNLIPKERITQECCDGFCDDRGFLFCEAYNPEQNTIRCGYGEIIDINDSSGWHKVYGDYTQLYKIDNITKVCSEFLEKNG